MARITYFLAFYATASIGTSGSVNDDTDRQVAERFYKGLSAGLSLENAWLGAQSEALGNSGSEQKRLCWGAWHISTLQRSYRHYAPMERILKQMLLLIFSSVGARYR